MQRGFQRLAGDYSFIIAGSVGNSIMALIIGSVFYNLPDDTSGLYSRGSLLFFAILLNAFSSQLEILTLYAQRPIVEKHTKYAFYHPFSEALSSMLCDLPNKLISCTCFNLILYFMTNLRREPGAFFIFYLFNFVCILAMSMFFRCIASLSRTLTQALVPSTIVMLALVIYTGFAIPITYMKPWFRWINYIDPVAYAFEALMINEFRNRQIPCSVFIPTGPTYSNVASDEHICTTTGSLAGSSTVDGNTYLELNFGYSPSHLWRNLGILIGFVIGLLGVYIAAAEFISSKKSKGEVLIFPRGKTPSLLNKSDTEGASDPRVTAEMALTEKVTTGGAAGEAPPSILKQTAIFHWDGVNYDIKIKKEPRRLLDDVDGWVKPGTLTALMVFPVHFKKPRLVLLIMYLGCFWCRQNYPS
jgi:ATP-binding cassette subfamily G (WHITE) protein 2 (PDR)